MKKYFKKNISLFLSLAITINCLQPVFALEDLELDIRDKTVIEQTEEETKNDQNQEDQQEEIQEEEGITEEEIIEEEKLEDEKLEDDTDQEDDLEQLVEEENVIEEKQEFPEYMQMIEQAEVISENSKIILDFEDGGNSLSVGTGSVVNPKLEKTIYDINGGASNTFVGENSIKWTYQLDVALPNPSNNVVASYAKITPNYITIPKSSSGIYPNKVGMWVKIDEQFKKTDNNYYWIRFSVYEDGRTNKTYTYKGFTSSDENRWKWIEIDLTSPILDVTKTYTTLNTQLNTGFALGIVNDNYTLARPGEGTIYIDNVTLMYDGVTESNVNFDKVPPEIADLTYGTDTILEDATLDNANTTIHTTIKDEQTSGGGYLPSNIDTIKVYINDIENTNFTKEETTEGFDLGITPTTLNSGSNTIKIIVKDKYGFVTEKENRFFYESTNFNTDSVVLLDFEKDDVFLVTDTVGSDRPVFSRTNYEENALNTRKTFAGEHSLEWSYNLVTGTSSYLRINPIQSSIPKMGTPEKYPTHIGMWVKVDSNYVNTGGKYLRFTYYENGTGTTSKNYNSFTQSDIDVWKWITIPLELIESKNYTLGTSSGTGFTIGLVKYSGVGGTGTIYIDNVTFLYGDQNVNFDSVPPEINELTFGDSNTQLDGATVPDGQLIINTIVKDKQTISGSYSKNYIDHNDIVVTINGQKVEATKTISGDSYDVNVQGITLNSGQHTVVVSAKDKYGFVTKKSATFNYETTNTPELLLEQITPKVTSNMPIVLNLDANKYEDFESATFTIQINDDFTFKNASFMSLDKDKSYVDYDLAKKQLKVNLVKGTTQANKMLATLTFVSDTANNNDFVYNVLSDYVIKYDAVKWPNLNISLDTSAKTIGRNAQNINANLVLSEPKLLDNQSQTVTLKDSSNNVLSNQNYYIFDEFYKPILNGTTGLNGEISVTLNAGFYKMIFYNLNGATEIPITVYTSVGEEPTTKLVEGITLPNKVLNLRGTRLGASNKLNFDIDNLDTLSYKFLVYRKDTPSLYVGAVYREQKTKFEYENMFEMDIYAPYTYSVIAVSKDGLKSQEAEVTITEILSAPWNQYFVESTPKKYEHRGAWLQTLASEGNFPSVRGNTEEIAEIQKKELTDFLDLAQQSNVNTVFFQVRPTADAYYKSDYLPWSLYLTGKQGLEPTSDPLEFIIEEAHKRNIELHAWFNPYRIGSKLNIPLYDESNVRNTHPEWVTFGNGVEVVDPGIPDARKWVEDTMMEVVKKYDVDGVHFDDYFYYEADYGEYDKVVNSGFLRQNGKTPYEEFNTLEHINGRTDLPNGQKAFNHTVPFSNLQDWRENNINLLIKELRIMINKEKPWLQFGIGPAGVWANKNDLTRPNGEIIPGNPNGSDTEAGAPTKYSHGADTLLWAKEGWIDYLAPQVYWSFSLPVASYGKIMDWWTENLKGTNTLLYSGTTLGKVNLSSQKTVDLAWLEEGGIKEIERQLRYSANKDGVAGLSFWLFWSKLNLNEVAGLIEKVQSEWQYQTLPVPMPWKGIAVPNTPEVIIKDSQNPDQIQILIANDTTKYYVLYHFASGETVDINNVKAIVTKIRANKNLEVLSQDITIPDFDPMGTYLLTAVNHVNQESVPKDIYKKDSPIVDKTILARLLIEIKSKDFTIYTVESVEVVKNMLSIAEALLLNQDATQEQVNKMITDMEYAISKLVIKKTGVDKTLLVKLITETKAKDFTIYTIESVEVVKNMLSIAEALLLNQDATQEQVNKMITDVEYAISKLVIKKTEVDKTLLVKLVTETKAKDFTIYTIESVEVVKNMLSVAEALLLNQDATQEQVNKMITDMEYAISKLVIKKTGVDKTALSKLVIETKAKNLNIYTNQSVLVLNNVLVEAEALLLNQNSTQQQVDDLIIKLQKAISNLVLKYNDDNNKKDSSSDDNSSKDDNSQDDSNQVNNKTIDEKVLEANKKESAVFKMEQNEIKLKAETIKSLINSNKPLILKNKDIEVSFSKELLNSITQNAKEAISIIIVPKTQKILDNYLKMDSVNKKLASEGAEIKLNINNKDISKLTYPIKVSIPIEKLNLSIAQLKKLTGVRYVNGEKVNQLGGTIVGKNFVFYTSEAGNYGILVSDTLKSLKMDVSQKTYTINDEVKQMDVTPFIENNITMMPIRFISEALGAEISWDDKTKTVTLKSDNKEVKLTQAKGNENSMILKDNRSFVPLRFVAENFESNVLWDADTRTVSIYK